MADEPTFRVPKHLLLPWPPSKNVSTTIAAEMLGCSLNTIIRFIEEGALKAYRLRPMPSAPWNINYDSVIDLIEKIHTENGLEKRFTRE